MLFARSAYALFFLFRNRCLEVGILILRKGSPASKRQAREHNKSAKTAKKGERSLVLVGLEELLVKEIESRLSGNHVLRTHGIRIT